MSSAQGIVERCTPKRISGWVVSDEGQHPDVVVKVNGAEVARTVASKPVQHDGVVRNCGFSRVLGDMWQYLGPNDAVSFECDGKLLPITGHGFSYFYTEGQESKAAELTGKVGNGYIFDKKGHLGVPLHQRGRWLRLFFSVFAKLREELLEKFGVEPIVFYGTLLGAIREGNFLNHDNDVDLVYYSKHTDPLEVRREYIQICDYLIGLGYRGFLTKHGFAIKSPVRVDLNFAWFNTEGNFQASFGYHGPDLKYSKGSLKFKRARLGKYRVRVPANSDAILEHLYGAGWKVPDPGFSHYTKARKFDPSYWATVEELAPVFWHQFYRNLGSCPSPSLFATAVSSSLAPRSYVVDLGCGAGADAFQFAEQGHEVLGFDLEAQAIARAEKYAVERGVGSCAFSAADLTNKQNLETLAGKLASEKRPIVIFARCFFNVVPEAAEDELLAALTSQLGEFVLAVELMTDRVPEMPAMTQPPFHRLINEAAFLEKLRSRYGMTIDQETAGVGSAPYKGEKFSSLQLIARYRS